MAEHPLLNTFGRPALSIERGEGIWLYNSQGKRYLDTFSGAGECGLGHAHPAVQEALAHQAGELTCCATSIQCELQHTLGMKLCDLAEMDSALLFNSAGEANETAIRVARQFGAQKGIAAPTILVVGQNSHRGTLATESISGSTGNPSSSGGLVRVPFNDVSAIREIASARQDVVAVLMETVQTDAGVVPADQDYLQEVQALCTAQGWLLMLDETQTGIGRTGTFFSYQHYTVTPDLVTVARGLGNGCPVAACLIRGPAAEAASGAAPGSVAGGNPLGCAAALAVISTLENDHLVARARALGNRMMAPLRDYIEGAYYVREIRKLGLAIGIELQEPCTELALLAKTQGLLIDVAAERVIRLLPALTMTDTEADEMAMRLIRLIKLYMADERKRPRR